jgi:hypothetical protein
LAWTKLHELQGAAERDLLKLWRSRVAFFRARALHLLARIKGTEEKYLDLGLKDSSPDVRITALRIARSLKLDVIPYVRGLVKDPSPQVRREAAIALRHNKSSEAPKLWAQFAAQHDAKDRWHLEALGIGADQQWDACFDAWLAAVSNEWNTPAGREIIWRSRSSKTPGLLVKILTDSKTAAEEKPRYLRSMDFLPKSPEKDAALAELAVSSLK